MSEAGWDVKVNLKDFDFKFMNELVNVTHRKALCYRINRYIATQIRPFVPYKTGRLSYAHNQKINMYSITYTAIEPHSGFDYAERIYYADAYGLKIHKRPGHYRATSMWDEVAFSRKYIQKNIEKYAKKEIEQELKSRVK